MTDRANRVYGDQEREKVNNENLSLKKECERETCMEKLDGV